MGTRGRKSADELAVVTQLPARPEPPCDLPAAEAAEWREITRSMPADWFPRETHGLLAQYCRHIVASRKVGDLLADADIDDVPAFARLLRMQIGQSSAIAALSVKLRLSQSSTTDRRKRKAHAGPKPWE